MFKNITFYQYTGDTPTHEQLMQKPLRDPSIGEVESFGFISADERSFTFGINTKVVPPKALKKKVAQLASQEAIRTGKKINKYRIQEIKEAAFAQMLETAFVNPTEVRGYFDADRSFLVVDTASVKVCEKIIDCIRVSMGSFDAEPVGTVESVQNVLAMALIGKNELDSSLEITDNVALYNLSTPGQRVCVSYHPMDDDVLQHVRNGMGVQSISMTLNGMTFVLSNNLQVKSIKFSDICFGEDERDVDGDWLIMKASFARLFEALDNSFTFL